MNIDLDTLHKLLIKSFKDTYSLQINENHLKSSKLLFEFANNTHKTFFDNETLLKTQKVSDNCIKSSGEWLYDACITRDICIKDNPYKTSAFISVEILLAIEFEFNTSLKCFAEDFGKLLCSNCSNLIYVAGLNQKTPEGRKSYIERRIKVINNYLVNHLNNLVIVFFPSPEKGIYTKSLWNEYDFSVLCEWINIYYYDSKTKAVLPK